MTTLFPNNKLIHSFLTQIHTLLHPAPVFSHFREKSQNVNHEGCTEQLKNPITFPQETQEPGKFARGTETSPCKRRSKDISQAVEK